MNSKSVTISILATALIVSSKTTCGNVAFIDITVLRETEKAILIEVNDIQEQPTGETEWLPKKALTASKIMGNDVYSVSDWFNEKIDHDKLNGLYAKYGYLAATS